MSIEDEILLSYKYLFDVLNDGKNKNKVTIFIDSDENKYLPISVPKNEIEGKNSFEKPFWFQSAYVGTIRTASRFTSGHSAGVDSDS